MNDNLPRIEIKDINTSILVRVIECESGIIKQYCNIARLDYGDGYLTKTQAKDWAKKIVEKHKTEWSLK